ncbi:MAG: hypothetical protein HYZ34_13730 [Ignavibacteriae bacterium]|nr:hypothetical protein [Ignavibacteriota bacterium]
MKKLQILLFIVSAVILIAGATVLNTENVGAAIASCESINCNYAIENPGKYCPQKCSYNGVTMWVLGSFDCPTPPYPYHGHHWCSY